MSRPGSLVRLVALAVLASACVRDSRPAPNGYAPPPPGYHPQGNPGYAPPGYAPPHGPAPQAPYTPPPATATPPATPPPAPHDPLTTLLGQLLAPGAPPLTFPQGFPLPPGWQIPGTPAPTTPTPPPPVPPPPAQPGHAQGTLPPIAARALELANTINAYRQQNGLPPIPITRALTHVAETHVRDLASAAKRPGCNAHSWSDRGGQSWSGCCYTADHAQAQCMWKKPAELTHYTSTGFEIAIGQPGENTGYVLDSSRALELWKSSALHHDVILNRATWQSTTWRAMGAGIIDSHAAVWFAKDPDPTP